MRISQILFFSFMLALVSLVAMPPGDARADGPGLKAQIQPHDNFVLYPENGDIVAFTITHTEDAVFVSGGGSQDVNDGHPGFLSEIKTTVLMTSKGGVFFGTHSKPRITYIR